MITIKLRAIYICVFWTLFSVHAVFAQTTAFSYQGKLNDGGAPASASYDMQFRLFDLVGAGQGTQQGPTVTNATVMVANGHFAVSLDFGSAVFASGADRFLEISLRPAGNTGGYTSLAPRQKLTSSPYSVRSSSANTADSLSTVCIGCVQSANINSVAGSKVTGTVASAASAVNAANATNAATAGNVSGIVAIANGGTGSAKQNFVDVTTDQTIDGNKTFNGTISAGAFSGDGSALTNVFQIQRFGGLIGNIPSTGIITFIGAATVTVNGTQRITGSGTADLGLSSGSNSGVTVSLCYKNTKGGPIAVFAPTASMQITVSNNHSTFALSETTVPVAGEYLAGYCVNNFSGTTLNSNGFVSGWIMVTNN